MVNRNITIVAGGVTMRVTAAEFASMQNGERERAETPEQQDASWREYHANTRSDDMYVEAPLLVETGSSPAPMKP